MVISDFVLIYPFKKYHGYIHDFGYNSSYLFLDISIKIGYIGYKFVILDISEGKYLGIYLNCGYNHGYIQKTPNLSVPWCKKGKNMFSPYSLFKTANFE